jgi:hypothetical protein
MSYYEINVVRDNKHWFATAKRSLSSKEQAVALARDFAKRFPECKIVLQRREESATFVSFTETQDEVFKRFKSEIKDGTISVNDALFKLSEANRKVFAADGDCVKFREDYLTPLCKLTEVQDHAQSIDQKFYDECHEHGEDEGHSDPDEWATYEVLSRGI